MNINLVKCNKEDVDTVFNLTREHIYQYETRKELNLKKVIERVKVEIYSRPNTIYRIYDNENHIGYISVIPSEDETEISDFFIKNEYQNQGYGTSVLSDLVNRYNHLTLYVFKNNDRAVKLYLKFNFRIIENNTSTYRMEMKK